MTDANYSVLNKQKQDGTWEIEGVLNIKSPGQLQRNGVDVSDSVAAGSVAGVASGYKLARGEAAFDGSNPTTVASGLGTIIAVVATLKGTSAPGDNTSVITANINSTNIDFYAWKNTGGTDPTLVASTGTESFYWIAIGTA